MRKQIYSMILYEKQIETMKQIFEQMFLVRTAVRCVEQTQNN